MIAPPRTRIVVRVGAPQRVAGLRRPAQRPGCRGPAEMARLYDAFIDDLLARTDIVEVINARVPLKRQGKEYSARCPFHDERSRSEESTSEIPSLMRNSYAVICLKKKN